MLYNIGIPGLIIILLIVLIIVGPGKLPELGRAFGKTISDFKNESKGLLDETEDKK